MGVYQVLKTDAEFLTAALCQARVTVIEHRGDRADIGGPVQKFSRAVVTIADA